jgi:hypothetical protein
VAFFEKVGANEQETKKVFAQGLMIKGLLGWQTDGRCWLPVGPPDQEEFTVAFTLPSSLKRFTIGVVDSKGGIVKTNAFVDLTKPPEKRGAASAK